MVSLPDFSRYVSMSFYNIKSLVANDIFSFTIDQVLHELIHIETAYDIWKGTNAIRDADGTDGSTRRSNWLCSVSSPFPWCFHLPKL